MANFTDFNSTNITSNFLSSTKEDEKASVPEETQYIITMIINGITCPFTVLLNVLVIMAVKRRPRLQTNANILLACLAATDTLTGLIAQPLFILLYTLKLLGFQNEDTFVVVVDSSMSVLRILTVCSCLHLIMVTFERLFAIKFTMQYPYIVHKKNIGVVVSLCWIFTISFEGSVIVGRSVVRPVHRLIIGVVLISCIVFIASAYLILYRETLRHKNLIKTQQLPLEEVARFSEENKALKTTVFVVGGVVLCILPGAFLLIVTAFGGHIIDHSGVNGAWFRSFLMLNSLLNPLIYCWRQKEIRNFVFRFQTQAVVPDNSVKY